MDGLGIVEAPLDGESARDERDIHQLVDDDLSMERHGTRAWEQGTEVVAYWVVVGRHEGGRQCRLSLIFCGVI